MVRSVLVVSPLRFGLLLLGLLTCAWVLPPAAVEAQEASTASSIAAALEEARDRLAAGDREGAVRVLEAVADPSLDPAVAAPAVAFLAGLYLETGRAEEALALLEPLLERGSQAAGAAGADEPPELLFMAARASQALGREDEAEDYLVRSAAAAPLSWAAVLLATLRSTQERHAEAERLLAPLVAPESFRGVVEREPDVAAEIAVHYASTLMALDRPADAVPYLQQAAALRPDDPEVLHELAEALVDAGRIDEARLVLERELALRHPSRLGPD